METTAADTQAQSPSEETAIEPARVVAIRSGEQPR
jgi:hypothetical protein